ncbi:DUF3043 domain-containing protein [Cellulomonas hominis]
MFGRSKDSSSTPGLVGDEPVSGFEVDPGKGRPTPKRKVAEAANKRPLVPDDRRAAAKSARAAQRVQRDRQFAAMQTGDERHLPAKDKGPVRRYIRNYVDARRNLGEYFLPAALVLLVLQLVLAGLNPNVAFVVLLFLYVFVIAMVVDVLLMWRRLKRRLVAKFDEDARAKGLMMYAILRVFQIRRARLPKPQVKHGEHPE